MGFFQTTYGKPTFPNTVPNKVVSLTTENFVPQPTGGFVATVNHGLGSQSLIVNVFDDNKKSIMGCVTLKDDNTLEVYNEEAINCTVVINRGNVDLSSYCEMENADNGLIKLKDKNGVYGNPMTKSDGVFMPDGNTTLTKKIQGLDEQLDNMENYIYIKMFPRLALEIDDTNRIKRAIESCKENDTLVLNNQNEFYSISDTIIVNKNINFIAEGNIAYNGSKDKQAFIFDSLIQCKIQFKKLYDYGSINDKSKGFHGWNNNNYIGIELNNLKQCNVNIDEVCNFTVGVKCKASSGKGFWFNNLTIQTLLNNKAQLELNGDGANSWLNANYFYDTSFNYNGSDFINSTIDKYSILQTLTNGCIYNSNSNIFKNYKFECNVTHGGVWTQIKLVNATNWYFEFRYEINANTKFAVIDLTLTKSDIVTKQAHTNGIVFKSTSTIGNLPTIEFVNCSSIKCPHSEIATFNTIDKQLLISESDLNKKYRWVANAHHIIKNLMHKPLASVDLNEELRRDYSSSDRKIPNGVNVTPSYPIVFYVSNLKLGDEITIETLSSDGLNSINYYYKPFDSSNVLIDNGVKDGVIVLGTSATWRTSNKCFSPPTTRNKDTISINHSDLKTLALMFAGNINTIKIYSTNNQNTIRKSMNDLVNDIDGYIYDTKPTKMNDGYFMPKDIVYNSQKSGDIGWILENGTWVSIGTY